MHKLFPLPDPEFEPLKPFWEGAANHKLMLPFIRATQQIEWYPTGELSQYEWKQVSGAGSLFSWVIVNHAFLPQYKSALPFITGLVSIAENPGVRLATRIANVNDPAELKGDMKMKVVFEKLSYEGVLDSNGNPAEIIAPFFEPA